MATEQQLKALIANKIKISRGHKLFLNLVFLGVWISGLAWLSFDTFVRVPGEFGPLHHELQPLALKVHGVLAYGSLVLFGSMLMHMRRGFALRRNVLSGSLFLFVIVLLIVTGLGLYYFSDRGLRDTTALVHWIAGIFIPIFLIMHPRLGRRKE